MEDNILIKTLTFSLVSLILYSVGRVVQVYWLRPKSLEKQLRQQGIRGRSYKLFQDDMKEIKMSSEEAWSKPMSLKHQIAPRVFPFFDQMVQNYGKVSLGWFETRPRLIVAEPELMKLILADKSEHITKPPLNPLVNLLQLGVSTLEGDQWAKRRRLITPAFHLEKLKGMVPAFVTSSSGLINRWENLIGVQGSCEVDVAPEFQNLAGDVIARTAFGSSFEEGKKIFELQKKQAVLVLEAYYGFYFPGLRFIPTKKKKMRYNLDNEIKTIRGMISRKEQAMENGEVGSNDLVTLFLQYDPKYWGEQVEEFNPERFAEGAAKASKDQFAFYPFGWGPRICLGQTFAVIEAKMALAMILQHFSFELSPSYIHAPIMGMTLQPQHGAPIILHRI
ncbi:hypothetical protein PRUPE_1G404900 [Prunus persica]|uniref:Cytochrome P450 n=1 Tax=Prunus persica TaxID=3760 RepID=A0A251RAS1_PRUPE|nr:hypothetical protein PRUPE_1G404900 [Prunus persica]